MQIFVEKFTDFTDFDTEIAKKCKKSASDAPIREESRTASNAGTIEKVRGGPGGKNTVKVHNTDQHKIAGNRRRLTTSDVGLTDEVREENGFGAGEGLTHEAPDIPIPNVGIGGIVGY